MDHSYHMIGSHYLLFVLMFQLSVINKCQFYAFLAATGSAAFGAAAATAADALLLLPVVVETRFGLRFGGSASSLSKYFLVFVTTG
jgi:hypothetical protein